MKRTHYWLLATLILLLAAGLRLWQLHALPPGPHYDEAANVLITRSIAFGGANYFPIVNSYQGREALFYYLNAPLFHLIDDGHFTMQLSNAFANLITIAATIALGRAMCQRRGRRGVVVGLVAGALMALSFPLILLSRQGFRAPTLPLMQALALVCLWRGLNSGRWRWWIFGGFFGGAALYTYMASRLFPMWLLAGGLLLVALDAGRRGLRLRQGLVFFGVLTLTALPMLLYALQNPDIFLGRLQEVTHPDQSVTLVESVMLHLRMFFIEGEQLLRYNLPGRSYFTWPEGVLLLAGLGVSMWRLLRAGRASERAAYGLLLLSPLMVMPSVISVGGFPPNHMRSIGMVPLVFVVIGVGADALLAGLREFVLRVPDPHPASLEFGGGVSSKLTEGVKPTSAFICCVAMIGLVIGAFLVGNVYFTWSGRADLFYDTDGDLAVAADWLRPRLDGDSIAYIAARDRNHPTVVIENLPNVTWLGTDTLFRPPPGKTGIAVFPRSAPPPDDWFDWLEPYSVNGIPLGPDGRPAFQAFRLEGDTPLPQVEASSQPAHNVSLSLIGVSAKPIFAGAVGEIVVQWRMQQPSPFPDLTPLVQIEDEIGTVLARAESPLRHTDDWRPGEVLMHRMAVQIPVGTPPGRYPVRMTWVGRESDQYLPFIDETGAQTGIWATVGQVKVLRPASFPDGDVLPIANRYGEVVSPGVRLLGWGDLPGTIRPGEFIPLTLYWQAIGDARTEVAIQPVMIADGTPALLESPPSNYPPSRWVADELVTQSVRWLVPRQQAIGQHTLMLQVDNTGVELGALKIAGMPRIFERPPVETLTETMLGESLQLYGYSLDTDDDIRLGLVWYASSVVDIDYTVFIHVLDNAGNIVVQRDVMPMDNTYPTSLWDSGEYVLDWHPFPDLPPGSYDVRVGLYDQTTGTRLKRINGEDFIDLGRVEVR